MRIKYIEVPYCSTGKILNILSFLETCSFSVALGKEDTKGFLNCYLPTVINFNSEIKYDDYMTIKDEIARLVREGSIDRVRMRVVDFLDAGLLKLNRNKMLKRKPLNNVV